MIRSFVLLVVCASLWGSNFVFGTILLKEFPPILLAAIRLSCTSLFLAAVAVSARRLVRITFRDVAYLIPIGTLGTMINQVTFFTGLRTTNATTAALILALSPITTVILAAIFLREPFTKRIFTGSLIALCGVFFVIGDGSSLKVTPGILLLFLSMLAFSASVILTRKLTERLNSFVTTVYATLFGSFSLIPIAVATEPHARWGHDLLHHPLGIWLLLISTAVVMQGICGFIWNRQLQLIGAGKAAIFLNLQPFVAMLVGFCLLGSTVNFPQIAGSILIICGVATASIRAGKVGTKPKPPTQVAAGF